MKRKNLIFYLGVTVFFCSCYHQAYLASNSASATLQTQNRGLINQNIAKIILADSLRNQNESLKQKNEILKNQNNTLKTENANIKN